jgi:asparagine synthase (glutamine-hydrolysing)
VRVTSRQQIELHAGRGFGIGLCRLPALDEDSTSIEGATESQDRRFVVWVAGEVFTWDNAPLKVTGSTFRRHLLAQLITKGGAALCDLNGEYQIALWDRAERKLALYSDRFAALPIYWTANATGFAFAGGVRGVLMAPAVDAQPDAQAIREAVSFGGFRLGGRTNIAGVTMAPGASEITVQPGHLGTRRYWSWREVPREVEMSSAERLEHSQAAWRRAVALRTAGSGRPGLLLSGGLDSRAILAEATAQGRLVTAVSYGVRESDDVRFARRAARVAGASWELFPLYADGWVERRLSHLHATDGLINFVDLMHAEVLPQLASHMDVYLSGYIGDVVSGGTYLGITTADDLLSALPYYGGDLGLAHEDARSCAAALIEGTAGDPSFAIYEHKLPQAISRITEAARPWVRVRRPFVDYSFWSQSYRVPRELRRDHHWHEHWLRSTYPTLFARIPNQRTGAPPGASRLRRQVTRVARFGWRRTLAAAKRAGMPATVPQRSYHPDWAAWQQPEPRDLLTRTILRSDSISAEVFGRDRVAATLDAFFAHDAAPSQVIGALFVYEHYHQSLASALRGWRAQRATA